MTGKRILLTGATGFVGEQILSALKNRGHFVRAISRKERASGLADEYIQTKDVFAEPVEWWEKRLIDIDTVIHAAWYVEHGKYLYAQENFHCLEGSLRLLEAFEKSSAMHFAGVGTCFEYDLDRELLSIDTKLKPVTPYAEAKVKLFEALKERFSNHEKSFTWCRLFYLYGENEHPERFFSYLHKQLANGNEVELTSGNQVRDFLDVKIAGKIIADAALNNVQGAMNVCSGVGVTIRAMAENIADEYQGRHLLKFGAREDNPIDPPKVVGVP